MGLAPLTPVKNRHRRAAHHETMEQSLEWSAREVWVRKLLYPGHTLPTAVAPAVVAGALAWRDGVFDARAMLGALLAGWLIQLGGVLVDNFENLMREPDDREHPELVHAVETGRLTLAELRAAIYACYGTALLAGAYLLNIAGLGVLVIGLASIAASWAYSAGPFPIGRHGFADPLFFLFFGVVSVAGIYYVQAAPAFGASLSSEIIWEALPLSVIAFGIPVGALTTNILIIDDIRDREFDVAKGKETIAVRFGAQWSRREFAALLAVAYLSPLWFWLHLGFSAWILLPLASLPYAASTASDVFSRDRYEELLPTTPKMGRLLLEFSALLGIGALL